MSYMLYCLKQCSPPSNCSSSHTRGQHFVRLNSIEPNTVMFSTKDYPILTDITVPEIIDELEKQFSDKLCDLQVQNSTQQLCDNEQIGLFWCPWVSVFSQVKGYHVSFSIPR